MDKEEILAKSREENKNRDFVEAEALHKGNAVAFTTGIMLCSLVSVLHAIFRDSVNYGAWVVMFGMMAAIMLTKYVKLKKRHELLLGLGYIALSVSFFVFYLHDVLGVF